MQTRRSFVVAGVGSCVVAGLDLGHSGLSGQETPPLPSEQVFEFVRVAHTDLGRTTEMLAEQPRLLNATWDWGNGDFETALGGASHMGNRLIAGFLLGHGARLDLFCAAAMGMIDVVRAVVDAYPDAVNWKGPHDIPLLRHAVLGESDEVVEFLEGRGAV
jgi:hypothetical protein